MAPVSRKVEDHRGLSVVWDAFILYKVRFENGNDSFSGGLLVLEQNNIGGGYLQATQVIRIEEILLEGFGIVDGPLERREVVRTEILGGYVGSDFVP